MKMLHSCINDISVSVLRTISLPGHFHLHAEVVFLNLVFITYPELFLTTIYFTWTFPCLS
jgi:hypothetical protein